MPLKVRDKMILIYRQMLPKAGFKYSINNVPVASPDKPESNQPAFKVIGDYALRAKLVDTNTLLTAKEFPGF